MEENSKTPLTDEFLQSLQGMEAVEPDPFFYTRLTGRMQRQDKQTGSFFKPAWAVIALCFFLAINTWMIFQEKNIKKDMVENRSPEQAFAETYHLNSDSNY
jgi:hypothetical protein